MLIIIPYIWFKIWQKHRELIKALDTLKLKTTTFLSKAIVLCCWILGTITKCIVYLLPNSCIYLTEAQGQHLPGTTKFRQKSVIQIDCIGLDVPTYLHSNCLIWISPHSRWPSRFASQNWSGYLTYLTYFVLYLIKWLIATDGDNVVIFEILKLMHGNKFLSRPCAFKREEVLSQWWLWGGGYVKKKWKALSVAYFMHVN